MSEKPTEDAITEDPGAGLPRPILRQGTILAVLLFTAVFAYGALSWVQFYLLPDGAHGNHTVLFTQTDFPAIVIASRMVASGQGESLYNFNLQLEGQRRLTAEGYLSLSSRDNLDLKYPYPYSPFIAVLWSPLSGLPPPSQMAIWDVLNLALMAGGLWYLLSSLPLRRRARLLLLLGGLTSLPFIINLQQGQSSGIVMFSLAVGIALLRGERDLPAGLALGLLLLKVQWLPFLVLVILWKRRWQALFGMALTAFLMLLLATLSIGIGWVADYMGVVVKAQQGAREFLLDPLYSHSLTGGFTALFGPGTESVARLVNSVVMVVLAGVLLYIWRGRWIPGFWRWDGAVVFTFLATILTNGHLNTHDLCLLALPAALGTACIWNAQGASGRPFLVWLSLTWAAYFILAFPPGLTLSSPLRLTTLIMGGMLVYMGNILLNMKATNMAVTPYIQKNV